MEATEPPELLYHGTAERNLKSIVEEGIQKMKRQHVHLSKDKGTASAVGGRHGKPIVLTINTKQMHENGVVFFLSENKVWLTDFVAAKYIMNE